MSRAKAAKTDPAAQVVASPHPVAPWRVAQVDAKAGMELSVVFADGTQGRVLMRRLLTSDRVNGTPFELLRDPRMFSQARVELGAVTWPCGADLAPDAMYDAIRRSGSWLVESPLDG